MNDSISLYIDDELNLDEKIDFVKRVHHEEPFYSVAVDLLEQEKLLCADVVEAVPKISLKEKSGIFNLRFLRPYFRVAEFGVVAVLLLLFIAGRIPVNRPETSVESVSKRFVVYMPEAQNVQIAGSFTNWNSVPMKMVGPSGYWEIELDVARGEHKYVFIVGGDKKIADPTILLRERDDFGSENSVLVVEA
ncbi:MAG: glycogen-binding domain-containing protein [Deltaproteobacteria bacterium]|nr:glycogen-binding domain-containing protein [Deltaproteobacteria bacterium]